MTITDRIQRFKGCRYPDTLPDGRTARVLWGKWIECERAGSDVPFIVAFPPGTFDFDCLRIGSGWQIAGTANVGGKDHAWLWDGAWHDKGVAPGRNAVAFDHARNHLVVCVGSAEQVVYDLASMVEVSWPKVETGALGVRFVSWDDRIITSESTYADAARGLYEFTDWGDVAIGQGAKPDQGIVVRFADDGILRRFVFGQCRDVRWERTNDTMALSWTQQDTNEACVWVGLLSELRTLDPVTKPQPEPGPVPPPDPPGPPPPAPKPDPPPVLEVRDIIWSQDRRFWLRLQNDGNPVIHGPEGSLYGLGQVWPNGWTFPTPEPEPGPGPALPRLRVYGRRLLEGDTPFVWRGVTAFRLVEMAAHGNEAGAAAYLDWARDHGFNVVRVLSMCSGLLFELPPEAGRVWLPTLLGMASDRGLYVHVVCLADTASYPGMDYGAHVEAVGRICADWENVALVEVANEPYHGTHAAAVHDVANLTALASRVPGIVPVALGASSDDESTEMKAASAITVHLDRGRDEWNMVRRVREIENVSYASGRYCINSEPIGAAEQNEPGRRNANPAIFFTFGALSRVFGVGSTFHMEAGLHCTIPGPVQQLCAEAFIQGTRIVLDDVALRFYNAGWQDSPVASARFAEGEPKPDACVRAYSGVWGNQAVTVVLGVMGDAGIVCGPGWRIVGPLNVWPGVYVDHLTKG